MSFDLSVLPVDLKDDPLVDGECWDPAELVARHEAAVLFEAPLGSDAFVGIYWSGIATTLDLPLLSRIYESGLRLQGTRDLDAVARELDRIEAAWESMELPEPG